VQMRESLKPDGDEAALADIRPIDLQWVHRLVHGAQEFAQSLALKRDSDPTAAWTKARGLTMDQTPDSIAFGWRRALRAPQDLRLLAVHLLSEGDAFRHYGALMPLPERLQILSGNAPMPRD
jgi:hypothetical protein